jgi:hypothetical protein
MTGDLCTDPPDTAFSASALPDQTLKDLALARFYQEAQDKLSPVKGGTILGELHETLGLLRRPLKGIRDLLQRHRERTIKALKRGRGRYPILTPHEVANALRESWLETALGWRPFDRDLSDVIIYLQTQRNRLSQDFIDIYGYAKSKKTNLLSTVAAGNVPSSYFGMVVNRRDVTETKVKIAGQVRVSCDGGNLNTTRDLGIIPDQFFPTLWELIPYSFVADYFANISGVVASFSVPHAAIAWCNRTSRSSRVSEWSGVVAPPWQGSTGSLSITVNSFVRDKLNPGLAYPALHWDPFLSLRRVTNIAALLGGFRSVTRRFSSIK